jgi:hypothetical protein
MYKGWKKNLQGCKDTTSKYKTRKKYISMAMLLKLMRKTNTMEVYNGNPYFNVNQFQRY